MRETLTTLGEIVAAAVLIYGVNVQFGRGWALIVGALVFAYACWALSDPGEDL